MWLLYSVKSITKIQTKENRDIRECAVSYSRINLGKVKGNKNNAPIHSQTQAEKYYYPLFTKDIGGTPH